MASRRIWVAYIDKGLITAAKSAILAITILAAVSARSSVAALSGSLWDHVPLREHVRTNPMAERPDIVSAGHSLPRSLPVLPQVQGDGHKRSPLRSEHIRTASDGDLEWFLRQGDRRMACPPGPAFPRPSAGRSSLTSGPFNSPLKGFPIQAPFGRNNGRLPWLICVIRHNRRPPGWFNL
jgi:hypothetical protein